MIRMWELKSSSFTWILNFISLEKFSMEGGSSKIVSSLCLNQWIKDLKGVNLKMSQWTGDRGLDNYQKHQTSWEVDLQFLKYNLMYKAPIHPSRILEYDPD